MIANAIFATQVPHDDICKQNTDSLWNNMHHFLVAQYHECAREVFQYVGFTRCIIRFHEYCLFPQPRRRQISPLEAAHPMPRFDGGQIVFDEAAHKYFVRSYNGDGVVVWTEYLATSSLYKRYLPDTFDADAQLARMRANVYTWRQRAYAALSNDEIKQLWDRNKNDAAARGTAMHAIIERVIDGRMDATDVACLALGNAALADEGQPELGYFLHFLDTWLLCSGLVPWRTEIRVFSRKYRVAGSIDGLFFNPKTGRFVIIDWKRSKDLNKENKFSDKKKGLGVLQHLDLTKYTQYAMQQNVYRWLIEHGGSSIDGDENAWDTANVLDPGTGLYTAPIQPYQVESTHLAVFHPLNEDFYVETLPDLQAEVQLMMDDYAAAACGQ